MGNLCVKKLVVDSSVEMTILGQFALIDPDLCTLVPHLKVEVNGP